MTRDVLTTRLADRLDADGSKPSLAITSLVKNFVRNSGEVVPAIDEVDLQVEPGELVVLVGPSGCGKTTLLRSIAGLEQPDSGSIELDGKTVFSSTARRNVPTERRDINMMFQTYALWPHMTVRKNVAYPAKTARLGKQRVAELTDRVLENVNITDLAMQYPSELSGGQQQRVALARALVDEPRMVLFDEPLSNVDAKVRETLRLEILRMHRALRFTAIYVTHDQTEAMQLADRVVIMRQGKVEQQGPPAEVYQKPRTLYVANFIGVSNPIAGTVVRAHDGRVTLATAMDEIHVDHQDVSAGTSAHAIIRPEDFLITEPTTSPTPNTWHGRVLTAMFTGPSIEYVVQLDDGLTIRTSARRADTPIGEGDAVSVSVSPERVHLVVA